MYCLPDWEPYRTVFFQHSNFAIWNSGPETFSKNKAVMLCLCLSLAEQKTRLIYQAFASVLIPGGINIGLGRFT